MHASSFVLKGGVLLARYVELSRYTQDIDFLVRKLDNDVESLEKILTEIAQIPIPDGFHFTDIKVVPLAHLHMKYPGARATLFAHFGQSRFRVTLDLGFGDLIDPVNLSFPLTRGRKGFLFESSVQLSCYPKEYIFAEKLETVVFRGSGNSRMKDFHDLFVLVKSGLLIFEKTVEVIEAVFRHRGTIIRIPILFSDQDMAILGQYWQAHLRGLPLGEEFPGELREIIETINRWLMQNSSWG